MNEREGPSIPVPDLIRAAIADHGPISFAEFMDLALYAPGGFYDRPPVGEAGHFVTSPHVHPVFGLLLAKAIREMWGALDSPSPLGLVEIGAGDGTLAVQLRAALAESGVDTEYVASGLSAFPFTVQPFPFFAAPSYTAA